MVERGISPEERLKHLMTYSQPMSDGRRALVLRLHQNVSTPACSYCRCLHTFFFSALVFCSFSVLFVFLLLSPQFLALFYYFFCSTLKFFPIFSQIFFFSVIFVAPIIFFFPCTLFSALFFCCFLYSFYLFLSCYLLSVSFSFDFFFFLVFSHPLVFSHIFSLFQFLFEVSSPPFVSSLSI